MVSSKTKVVNPLGLHMRPAQVFVKGVTPYKSSVTVITNGLAINAKSIMILMAACIKQGTEIEIQCEGPDEEQALQTAVTLVESGLGE